MGYNRKTTVYLNPSVETLLGEAEDVQELTAAYMQALKEYDRASAKTKRRWRRRYEAMAEHLRTREIVRPRVVLS
jgi:hypothetical protein